MFDSAALRGDSCCGWITSSKECDGIGHWFSCSCINTARQSDLPSGLQSGKKTAPSVCPLPQRPCSVCCAAFECTVFSILRVESYYSSSALKLKFLLGKCLTLNISIYVSVHKRRPHYTRRNCIFSVFPRFGGVLDLVSQPSQTVSSAPPATNCGNHVDGVLSEGWTRARALSPKHREVGGGRQYRLDIHGRSPRRTYATCLRNEGGRNSFPGRGDGTPRNTSRNHPTHAV